MKQLYTTNKLHHSNNLASWRFTPPNKKQLTTGAYNSFSEYSFNLNSYKNSL